jgi:outer membrane lipoprotein carrier protein
VITKTKSFRPVRPPLPALAAALLLGLPGWVAADEKLDSAVSGLQSRYSAVKTIQAGFEQHYRAPGIDQNESGVLWMMKPGLMRWEYRDPELKVFVADGRDTYLYTPDDRQVIVRSYSPSELLSTPLQFLLGRGDIRKSFTVSWESDLRPGVPGSLLLRLEPRTADVDYAHIVLELAEGSYDIRRMVIRERTGNTSEFTFSDLKTNVRIDRKQFQFKIPKGVHLVRLNPGPDPGN